MDIKDVKSYLDRFVFYKGDRFRLTGCTLRRFGGKFYYQAELEDRTGRSVTIVPLDRVETEEAAE
jgi:hypothetical protein